MLHPSYTELMNSINSQGEEPIVNSRYSVVIAAAKRARQIINGAESTVEGYETMKPLSAAVAELMDGSVKIVSGAANEEDDSIIISSASDSFGISIDEDDTYDEEGFEEEGEAEGEEGQSEEEEY